MKKIEAIIRQEELSDVKEAIFNRTSVSGLTVKQVLGCGQQLGWKEYVRGQEVMVSLLPKIELSVVVNDDELDSTIDTIISTCKTGEVGDGKIFVYDVQNAYRIRTGETGENVI